MATSIGWKDLELRDRLGEGQAGVVYRAVLRKAHKGFPLGTVVALKRYKRWVLEESGQYDRIYRELLAGLQIRHPNVVSTLAIVADDSGLPALVMKYYEGQTLEMDRRKARRRGVLRTLESSFQIVGELAAGLSAIHDAGLLHRDLKPSNVILTKQGAVLMDLGVVASKVFPEQSYTTQFLGTIRYAAPEYLAGDICTKAVDAFSLGAIAYELFTSMEFCHHVQHWAKLVAHRLDHYNNRPFIDKRKIAERDGINAAEAVDSLLHVLLERNHDHRFQDLGRVAELVMGRFWRKPFYVGPENQIIGGLPKTHSLPTLRSVPRLCTLAEAKRQLLRILPKTHHASFFAVLPDAYWSTVKFSRKRKAFAILWHRLGLLDLDVIDSEHPSVEYWLKDPCQYRYTLSSTMRDLYRYGYLA